MLEQPKSPSNCLGHTAKNTNGMHINIISILMIINFFIIPIASADNNSQDGKAMTDELFSLKNSNEVEEFFIAKSSEFSGPDELSNWMKEAGFIAEVDKYPEGHFKEGQSKIVAYWPTEIHETKSPFGGFYFGFREFLPTSGVSMHLNYGSSSVVQDVSLSFSYE